MDMTPQAWPDWYDGKHINEVLFCQQFLDKHPMKCVRGRLFTVDGLIEDEGQIGNLILEEISGVLTSGLSKVVTNLLASIKLQAYSPPLPIETDRIHVSNGTYFIDGSFTVVKSYCNNRLTVAYNPDAPTPKKWLQFLSELLQPEDIPTLQEFLGYCLLPTTKGQKMLMLIGKGGEGKSRIGLVMRSLLGDSMNTTSIQKVESNRFSRADLENKLLMVDDDMDSPPVGRARALSEGDCGSCGSRWTRLHFYQTASLAHAVGAGVSTLEAPVHGVVYCHPIPPPACVNLPPAAWHRYRGGTICSTPAGGTSYLTTYLLQSSTEEGLLRFTVALQKGR